MLLRRGRRSCWFYSSLILDVCCTYERFPYDWRRVFYDHFVSEVFTGCKILCTAVSPC